jgi:endonuclease I
MRSRISALLQKGVVVTKCWGAVLGVLFALCLPPASSGDHFGDPTLEAYYAGTENLSGQALRDALHEIVENGHTPLPYTSVGSFDVLDALQSTDEDPGDPNNVILIYSRRSEPKSNFEENPNLPGGANPWNREHIWPQSFGVADSGPDFTDLHHLWPADSDVNSSRGNRVFDASNVSDPNFMDPAHAEAPGNSSDTDSWEPPDSVKGDIARALLYMDVRYDGQEVETSDLVLMDAVPASGDPNMAVLSTLLLWHSLDPPDAYERARNEAIHSFQGNRNPFIDHPQWTGAIFSSVTPVPVFGPRGAMALAVLIVCAALVAFVRDRHRGGPARVQSALRVRSRRSSGASSLACRKSK